MRVKAKSVVCAVLALSALMAGGAFAQGSGNLNLPCDYGQSTCGPGPVGPGFNQQQYRRDVGPNQGFYLGGRLPPEYRGRHYIVDDWRGHRLSPPPRHHHWVQSGADYVLVNNNTGLIVQIVPGY